MRFEEKRRVKLVIGREGWRGHIHAGCLSQNLGLGQISDCADEGSGIAQRHTLPGVLFGTLIAFIFRCLI